MTRSIILHLTKLESNLKKSYWNTYYCANTLNQLGGKITGSYCKNRWCLVCNRIRTAVTINAYRDIINSWHDKQFVTLTIQNVKAEELSKTIDTMINNFTNINRAIKRRALPMKLVRKLEVTYNPISDEYHPHFHIIVEGREVAELIREEWLKRYPSPLALPIAQDIKPCTSETQLLELFKYFTKIISNTSKTKDRNGIYNKSQFIYINALDVIFNSIAGKRTFQNYGFKLKVEVEKADEIVTVDADQISSAEEYTWEWQQELTDWINLDTGEGLTGYHPIDALVELFEKSVFINKKPIQLLE